MNIYFSGIGGVGIGPLAQIALDAGYGVQGSDTNESRFTQALQSHGVAVTIGQDGEFLQACHDTKPIDWLVHTSALPSDHPELLLARRLGIKTAKRDELLAHIIADKHLKLIAVAGTHGKTTTTGMLIWTLQQLGIPVSYSVGTTLNFAPSGKFDPASEYFIYECDEFDRNFLHFEPYLSLITSIDYDHPDTYPAKSDYTAAFTQFIGQSHKTIMWHTDNSEVGATSENSWVLSDNEVVDLQLTGAHNRRNGTLVVKALEYLQLGARETTIEALAHFPGTDRRFEKLANNLYSDYGHHPVEIAATLQLARELSDHVVLIYQPHQNVRQHEIKNQYTDCFEQAEQIYWLPTYLSREDPNLPILTPEELIQNVANKNRVQIAELNDELWDHIQKSLDEDKLVLAMGAGTIDGWLRDKLAAMPSRS
jgi:UDP-N-acetylmuramate--alanine ligase